MEKTKKIEKVIKVTTFDPHKDKSVFVGKIIGDSFFRTVSNNHFMVKEGGYGLQDDVIKSLLSYGINKVIITTKSGTRHISNFIDWVKYGHKKDYGNGEQVFLNTKFCKTDKINQ